MMLAVKVPASIFLSTSPLRGTTVRRFVLAAVHVISIHVPLAGDDRRCPSRGPAYRKFLSTSPLRGTTGHFQRFRQRSIFLSTSPLRGTTQSRRLRPRRAPHFYPRPPCGGRRQRPFRCWPRSHFYPRPPCGGRPSISCSIFANVRYFYPRPPCGGRPSGNGQAQGSG